MSSAVQSTRAGGVRALAGNWRLLLPGGLGIGAAASDRDSAEALALSVPRTARALTTAAAVAADYRLSLAGLDKLSAQYLVEQDKAHERCAQRVLKLCRNNGGIYIKVGQFLSTVRSLPTWYQDALATLQDGAPSRPFDKVRATIIQELGEARLNSAFQYINPEAAASASLAQVHRATLSDGREVAVKVQHAGLPAAIRADMATLRFLATSALVAADNDGQIPDLRWVVDEMQSNLNMELDFRQEGGNAERLQAALDSRSHRGGHHPKVDVAVPRIHWDLSTKRVLVMEWIDGLKVSDAAGIAEAGMRPAQVGEALVSLAGTMAFCVGFIHADLHPGNVMVRRAPSSGGAASTSGRGFAAGSALNGKAAHEAAAGTPQLVILDHGLYTRLSEEMRLDYCRLWRALGVGDMRGVADAGAKLDGRPDSGKAWHLFVTRPESLTHEQRVQARKDAGVGTPAEVVAFLEALPRPLTTALRTQGLVRNVAEGLGVSRPRRMQLLLQEASEGLTWQHGKPGPAPSVIVQTTNAAVDAVFRIGTLLRLVAFGTWRKIVHVVPAPGRGSGAGGAVALGAVSAPQ